MPAKKIKVTVWDCECAHCGNPWQSESEEKPVVCPKCRRRTWETGIVRLGRPPLNGGQKR